jgi:hypothetical protein
MADEQRVQDVVHELWEQDGRPQGQHQRYREIAREIVDAEESAENDTSPEEVGERVSAEPPILEDGLPRDEEESIIEENRLSLENPDGEVEEDEMPYRDDKAVGNDVPVQDRGKPGRYPPTEES